MGQKAEVGEWTRWMDGDNWMDGRMARLTGEVGEWTGWMDGWMEG